MKIIVIRCLLLHHPKLQFLQLDYLLKKRTQNPQNQKTRHHKNTKVAQSDQRKYHQIIINHPNNDLNQLPEVLVKIII